MSKQTTRTVLGVQLTHVVADTWAADGWEFRVVEGGSIDGRQEWWCYPPKGQEIHTGASLINGIWVEDWTTVVCESSLRGCVKTMLATRDGRRQTADGRQRLRTKS